MEVAELFPAEGGAAAAAAFGVDVAALEALGCGVGGCVLDDVGAPTPRFWCKIFKRKGLSSYLETQAGSMRESQADAGLCCVFLPILAERAGCLRQRTLRLQSEGDRAFRRWSGDALHPMTDIGSS